MDQVSEGVAVALPGATSHRNGGGGPMRELYARALDAPLTVMEVDGYDDFQ